MNVINQLFRLILMNRHIIELYNNALQKVLEEYGITERSLFNCNCAECTEARMALIVALSEKMSDKDIAECTHKMRRCSVCSVRNRYDDKTAPWTLKRCIQAIKGVTK